jgi:hypothetical protein
MAEHEALVAPFVQHIAKTGTVTHKRQVGEALALAALVAVRNRRGRHQIQIALAAGLAKRLRSGQVTPAQWEQLRASEIRHGADPNDIPRLDEAVGRLRDGTWFPKAPNVLTVGLIPDAQDAMLKRLQKRHWELHITDSTTNGGFICSDSPLVWGDLGHISAGGQPSLEDPEIEVTVPVSRKAALVSYPAARDGTIEATEEVVAHVNMRTLQLSMGLVFHSDDDFLLRRGSGVIARASEYFAYVQDARARGILRP